MLLSVKDFFIKYYKVIIGVVIGLFILYWLIYFTTPKNQMSEVDKYKIQLIDEKIGEINKNQKKIDSNIIELKKELVGLNKTISTIKKEKIIIKEIYDKKINRVDELNDAQLDSFFTNRYQ
jgi:septal ring factor EnvC (AmiA/AmiB activator)